MTGIAPFQGYTRCLFCYPGATRFALAPGYYIFAPLALWYIFAPLAFWYIFAPLAFWYIFAPLAFWYISRRWRSGPTLKAKPATRPEANLAEPHNEQSQCGFSTPVSPSGWLCEIRPFSQLFSTGWKSLYCYNL